MINFTTKKILLAAGIFVLTFIIAVIVCFPYTEYVSKIIDDVSKERKLDIRYEKLDVGLFGAEINKFATGDIEIDKITLSYNPLGLLFNRLSFKTDSPLIMCNGKIKGDSIEADIMSSAAEIAKLVKISGSGRLTGKVSYNTATGEGKAEISSGAISITHPLMKINADSFEAEANIKNNVITISKAAAKGQTTLDAKGMISLNSKKLEHSLMDISGRIGIQGLNTAFQLNGNFISPNFTVK